MTNLEWLRKRQAERLFEVFMASDVTAPIFAARAAALEENMHANQALLARLQAKLK